MQRRLVFLFFLCSSALWLLAASSGPNIPGTGATITNGICNAWTTPTGIEADDSTDCSLNGICAEATVNDFDASTQCSQFLRGTDFGFSIPSGNTIAGIELNIQQHDFDSDPDEACLDLDVLLLKAGSQVGSNHAKVVNWPTSLTDVGYGSPTDLWNTTWTATQINANNFGADLSVEPGLASGEDIDENCAVDFFSLTVHHIGGAKLLITETRKAGRYASIPECRVTLSTLYEGIEALNNNKSERLWEAIRPDHRSTFHKTRALARHACGEYQVAGVH